MLTQCGMKRRVYSAYPLALGLLALGACVEGPTDERGFGAIDDEIDVRGTFQFDALTPTGEEIFRQSLAWMDEQKNHPQYPKKRMCANNVSHVLEESGLTGYSAEAVVNLAGNVAEDGIEVLLPRDEAGMISEINSLWGGRIPAGAIVAGCLRRSCWVSPGDAHVGIVGVVDDDGNILLYHNNWYRPDNNNGVWVEHMVSREFYYERGWRRQWMPTPWIKLVHDETGALVHVISALPPVDDLDPRQYYLRIEVPRQIALEIDQAVATDGEGGITELALEQDPRLPDPPVTEPQTEAPADQEAPPPQ